MTSRQDIIAASVQSSVVRSPSKKITFLAGLPDFFCVYWHTFKRVQAELFKALRGTWDIDEDAYRASFGGEGRNSSDVVLEGLGDMGYSGSTFFQTPDSAFLIKSIPRYFEHSFFRDDMLVAYAEHLQLNHNSLLIRITDFLEAIHYSIGTVLGLAPSHHVIMENLMRGSDDSWESWDLKPMSYFYPERDIAGGVLSSEATKSKLADDFTETIYLDLDQAEELQGQLEKDTKFLERCNAVDYSLFLVRIPADGATSAKPSRNSSWRTGVRSLPDEDGKQYIYKAAILDFFWAKHKVHAKAMTTTINLYNVFDRKGPMSVTTTAPEYRKRFLKMCKDLVETSRK